MVTGLLTGCCFIRCLALAWGGIRRQPGWALFKGMCAWVCVPVRAMGVPPLVGLCLRNSSHLLSALSTSNVLFLSSLIAVHFFPRTEQTHCRSSDLKSQGFFFFIYRGWACLKKLCSECVGLVSLFSMRGEGYLVITNVPFVGSKIKGKKLIACLAAHHLLLSQLKATFEILFDGFFPISLLKKDKKMKGRGVSSDVSSPPWMNCAFIFVGFLLCCCIYFCHLQMHIISEIWYHRLLLQAVHILHLSNNYSQKGVKGSYRQRVNRKAGPLSPPNISVYTLHSWVKFIADLEGLSSPLTVRRLTVYLLIYLPLFFFTGFPSLIYFRLGSKKDLCCL